MEVNMDALSVRWKSPKENEWRGAYQLSEKWKGKKAYVFVGMRDNGASVDCEVLQWWFILYFSVVDHVYVQYLVHQKIIIPNKTKL